MTEVHATATVRRSELTNELAGALAKAQGDYKVVEKKRTARVRGKTKDGRPYDYTFKYADLGDVLNMALPILAKHGIAFTQPTVVEGGVIYIRTTLMHSSGQWQESDYPVASFGDKKHQQIGEALTFAKRYAGCAALGIAPEETVEGDVDVGGDAEVGQPARSQPRQREAPNVVSGTNKPLPPTVGETDAVMRFSEKTRADIERCVSVENLEAYWQSQAEHVSAAPDNVRKALENLYAVRLSELQAKESKDGKPERQGELV